MTSGQPAYPTLMLLDVLLAVLLAVLLDMLLAVLLDMLLAVLLDMICLNVRPTSLPCDLRGLI